MTMRMMKGSRPSRDYVEWELNGDHPDAALRSVQCHGGEWKGTCEVCAREIGETVPGKLYQKGAAAEDDGFDDEWPCTVRFNVQGTPASAVAPPLPPSDAERQAAAHRMLAAASAERTPTL
ncbi:Hypothetical protein UVM_LOCUS92 [uncultured virus]|nr:Hypothetical protein UVM_LOCUS92 [uncultured virus]